MGFLHHRRNAISEIKLEVMELQERQLANIRMLNISGNLLIAGPIIEDGELCVSFLSTIQSQEKVKALPAEEVLAQVGLLEVDSRPRPGLEAITSIAYSPILPVKLLA